MSFDKSKISLDDREKERYDRQIIMKNFGEEGQKKLKSTTALVAGAGGLGSPTLLYLAAAGIGKIKIVDSDRLDMSNLNRQILYDENHLGKPKAIVAEKKLSRLNSDIEVESYTEKVNDDSIDELLEDCNVIVDCLDNFESRYVLNRASLENKIPLFHAAVQGMSGQATTVIPGETPCLRCFVPEPLRPGKLPVFGATPGLMSSIQVHEVIKYLLGWGNLLKNELLIVDQGIEFEKIEIQQRSDCKDCG